MIEVEQRRARLAVRHHLRPATRTDDLAVLADDLVALHSSDPVTVFLSAMTRMRQPSIAAVEQALYVDRTLIRHHAMRRTLWVATPATVRLMHAAATVELVGPERRRIQGMLTKAGVPEAAEWLARAEHLIHEDLVAHGPTTAREIGARVGEARHPLRLGEGTAYATVQSAHTRVLTLLGFRGLMLRGRPAGRWLNGAYRYTAAEAWLPAGLGDLEPRDCRGGACGALAAPVRSRDDA